MGEPCVVGDAEGDVAGRLRSARPGCGQDEARAGRDHDDQRGGIAGLTGLVSSGGAPPRCRPTRAGQEHAEHRDLGRERTKRVVGSASLATSREAGSPPGAEAFTARVAAMAARLMSSAAVV